MLTDDDFESPYTRAAGSACASIYTCACIAVVVYSLRGRRRRLQLHRKLVKPIITQAVYYNDMEALDAMNHV